VFLVLIGLGLQVDTVLLHRRTAESNQLAVDARQRESDTARTADDTSEQLDVARADAAAAAVALDDVRAALIAAGTSQASLAGDVAAAHAGLAVLQAQIDVTNATAATRASQFDQLRGCLDVGQRALDSVAVRSSNRVDATLATASEACASSATSAIAP
jgi:hypothetical protein